MNGKLGVVYQQLLKTANIKQQNTDNGLWVIEKHDIMFKILHTLHPMHWGPENCDIEPNFLSTFLSWPHNYYNDNNNATAFLMLSDKVFQSFGMANEKAQCS